MISECITYIIKNAVGIYLVLFILNKLIGYGINIKKIPLVVFSAVSLAITVLPFFTIKDVSLARDTADLSTAFLFVSIPYCVLERKNKFTFFWFGLIFNSVFDMIVTVIVSALHIKQPLITNIIYILLFIIVCVTSYITFRKSYTVSTDFFEKIPIIVYVAIFLASLSAYYSMMIPVSSDYSETVSRFLLIIASIIVIICMIYIIIKYLSVVYRQRDSLERLDMQVKHYEELADKNQSIRRFRHDIRNNIFALNSLISSGQYEQAQKYIEDMSYEISKSENKFSTGNTLADAIISKKYSDAEKYDIEITFSGVIPENKINDSDLCTLLSNSIDNAIRASVSCSPCKIGIEAFGNKDGIIFTVSNPVTKDIEIKNNNIQTTKKDSENHGFGLGNIKRTAEKYEGLVTLTCENKLFTIKIALLYQ